LAHSGRGAQHVVVVLLLGNKDILSCEYIYTHTHTGERISWLIRVEVHGTWLSPFYWAIRDGKFAIAEFMLKDLLTIRADTEDYYYGR
jgi:hypothetical protein